jgi:hypothetical protein
VYVTINKKKIPKTREVLSAEGLEVFKRIHGDINVIARC